MKLLVVLCAVAACAVAKPLIPYSAYPFAAPYAAPYVTPYAAPYYSAPVIKTQYHAQNEAGEASYGFTEPSQAQSVVQTDATKSDQMYEEMMLPGRPALFIGGESIFKTRHKMNHYMDDAFNNRVGSYSYIDAEGKLIQANYVADALGFRIAANNLPVAPAVPAVPELEQPKPVEDTAEVAEAKAKFLADFEEAKKGIVAPVAELELPKPVVDTPEVAEAKAKFLADFEEVKSRSRRATEEAPAAKEASAVQTPASTTKLADPVVKAITPVVTYTAAASFVAAPYVAPYTAPYAAPYAAYAAPYAAYAAPYAAYPYSSLGYSYPSAYPFSSIIPVAK